jgi:heme-degrading monooxygenase HmoA
VVIMGEAYTHSTWRVKPGLEDEFVRRWQDLAHWSALQGLTSRAKLLRDVDEPSRFVSFGPWESMESVRRWRAAPGFHERVARLQEVLDDFEPRTLKLVSER